MSTDDGLGRLRMLLGWFVWADCWRWWCYCARTGRPLSNFPHEHYEP